MVVTLKAGEDEELAHAAGLAVLYGAGEWLYLRLLGGPIPSAGETLLASQDRCGTQ
jgi:hypothetical protein